MDRPRHTGRRRRLVAGAAAAATGLAVLTPLLGPGTSQASSHREAPYTASDPRADNTDVYAFVSPDTPDSVTFIANWIPFEEPNGGPTFYPWGDGLAYDIEIDNDGDSVVDIVYRWVFETTLNNPDSALYNTGEVTTLDDEDLNLRQSYDLTVSMDGGANFTALASDVPVAPSNVGPASMPDYAALRQEAITDVTGGGQTFAGQADDSFFLDLQVFDLLYGGEDFSKSGLDTLNGYNVNTIALQVPKAAVAAAGNAELNPVIGVFSSTSRPSMRVFEDDGSTTESGDFAQVSRLGSPLVNEVVVPVGMKDAFNNSRPEGDEDFLPLVQDPELPRLVEQLYDIPAPDSDPDTEGTQRADLVQVFLSGIPELTDPSLNAATTDPQPSEMLRLNMGVEPTTTPERLGVLAGDLAGFPNGRRLTDDVLDIELAALEGALLADVDPEQAATAATLSDGANSNDLPFGTEFPYVALPHNSSVNASQFAQFERLAGQDRFSTAAAISRAAFASADTAILANGQDAAFADALAANYLAGDLQAPILLTDVGSTPEVTLDTLEALGVEDVVIVGGTARVSQAQQDALDGGFGTVTRVAGDDRFETARLVAAQPGADNVQDGTAILATGGGFADALVSGPIAYARQFPILLAEPGGLSPANAQALDDLEITRVLIAGGTAAVSSAVEADLAELDIQVVRLAGVNRAETAFAMATYARDELGFDPTRVNLARGDVPADALAGGPKAGMEPSVILLTPGPGALGAPTTAYLADQSVSLESGDVFGGTAAISPAAVAAATDAANSND